MSIFLTSDTHFGHSNVIQYSNRPFKDVEEMDETLIANWNEVVKHDDDVYHLGDFGFRGHKYLISVRNRLNGNIHLLKGNHDHKDFLKKMPFCWIKDYYELKVDGNLFILCHYPFITWKNAIHGSFHCFGHVHGLVEGFGRSTDVGVDCRGYKPVNLDVIYKELVQKEVIQKM